MDSKWLGVAVLVIGIGLAISCLVTRKALNPIQGLEPLIVTRDREPVRYWISVGMYLIPIGIGLVLIFVPGLN